MIRKTVGAVCAALILLVVIGVIAGPSKTATKPATAAKPPSPTTTHTAAAPHAPSKPKTDDAAVRYVAQLGDEAQHVADLVDPVLGDLTAKSPDAFKIASDAQDAHDGLNAIRKDFANTTAASNDAQLEAFAAANDLKNAMGSVVTWTSTPDDPAVTVKTTKQLQTAIGEWNDAVGTIWSAAHAHDTPAILGGDS